MGLAQRYLEVLLTIIVLVTLVFLVLFSRAAGVPIAVVLSGPAVILGLGYAAYVAVRGLRDLVHGRPIPFSNLLGAGAHWLRDKFEYVLSALIVFFGAIYCFLTPPMQVGDEAAHFYRAYEVSELNFSAEGVVPRNVALSGVSLVGTIPGRPHEHASLPKIFANYSLPLAESDKYQLTNGHHTARHYPPIAYTASALGIAVGRAFSFPPILLMYLGRICNVLLFAAFAFLIYRTLPFGKLLFASIVLLPMTLSLGSSLSADGPTAMLCFLSVAYLLRFAQSQLPPSRVQLIGVGVLICLAVLAKNGAYVAMPLLVLLLPREFFSSRKMQLVYFAATALSAVGLVLLWQKVMMFDSVYDRMAADTGTQRILERPGEYFKWIYEVITQEKGYMLDTFVGRLGWNDTVLPAWIHYSAGGLLAFLFLFMNTERIYPGSSQRIVFLLMVLVNALLIYYAFFSLNIRGMQGRYFTPLALSALLPLTFMQLNLMERLKPPLAARVHAGVALGIVVYFSAVHVSAFQTLLVRYWGF